MDGLEAQQYFKSDFILIEGVIGDSFYIIVEGEVECLKDHEDPKQDKIFVRLLKSGQHFGEIALLRSEKRTLSVKVKSEQCKVLCLSRDTFTRILGNVKINYEGSYDKSYIKF